MEIIDAGPVRIGVSATRVNGRDYVDIRSYRINQFGKLHPTSSGLLLPINSVSDIKAAIDREYQVALTREPQPLYYFVEVLADKTAERIVHTCKTSILAKTAVSKTPDEYGARKSQGYIFKGREYTLQKSSYYFKPTKPFAVWDVELNRWIRWENRN